MARARNTEPAKPADPAAGSSTPPETGSAPDSPLAAAQGSSTVWVRFLRPWSMVMHRQYKIGQVAELDPEEARYALSDPTVAVEITEEEAKAPPPPPPLVEAEGDPLDKLLDRLVPGTSEDKPAGTTEGQRQEGSETT